MTEQDRCAVADEPDPEDLTTRARIRDAAVRHFGERGFERATFRDIAETAGVTPSLIRHHFGSKQGLREACDEQLIKTIRRLNARIQDEGLDAAPSVRPLTALGPYQRYLARALSEGGATALFEEIVRLNEQWLRQADETRSDPPQADLRARAAVRTAMALSIAVMYEHVSRSIGADLTSQEGELVLMRALLDAHSHPMLTLQEAAATAAALDRAQAKLNRPAQPAEPAGD
jgi:AcrR family transcriptional regulator